MSRAIQKTRALLLALDAIEQLLRRRGARDIHRELSKTRYDHAHLEFTLLEATRELDVHVSDLFSPPDWTVSVHATDTGPSWRAVQWLLDLARQAEVAAEQAIDSAPALGTGATPASVPGEHAGEPLARGAGPRGRR